MSGCQFVTISVTNLSPFRSSTDWHASKVLQAASLARQLEDTANMESMFGQGGSFPLRRACSVDRINPGGRPNRVLSREAMSTGAMFWRQEQSSVDRSHVVATEAVLQVVRVDKGKMLSTEQCCVDRNILGGRPSSWGGLGAWGACLGGLGACLGGLGPV